jgi:SAM-dependent methyltransferase
MSQRLRQSAARALRRVRLLGLADTALYLRSVLKVRRANTGFRATHDDFPVPPSRLAFDAYGNVNNAAYKESGEIDARMIAGILHEHVAGDTARVCEWGCGPGRVIRHLRQFLTFPRVELYGTDYNAETIRWCQRHLDGISFHTNTLAPPLPFEDGFLNCVYAISVLTHLSEEKHFEWMAELKRIVRGGGIIALTTQSDASTDRLLGAEKARYAAGELVVRGGVREGKKWYLAYQPPGFMRSRLLSDWDVVFHGSFTSTQDVWVARK